MRLRTIPMLLLVASILGCASSNVGRPAGLSRPDLSAELANDIYFGSGSSAPANVAVRITNTANVPITIRRIELDSPSMASWGIVRHVRDLNKAIPPGTTEEVILYATARTTVSQQNEPLSLRVQFTFEAGESTWREYLNMIGMGSTSAPR